ncbi:MAG: ABC transporter permease [Rhodothermales bacterium]
MSRFNLDTALATWRRFLQNERTIAPDDLDELEIHIRDLVDEQVSQGMPAEAAFRRATQQIGSFAGLQTDYQRVHWAKLRDEHRLLNELRIRLAMFKNYLLVGLRAMRKQKVYTAINVGGLAIGLVCCFYIFLYVQHEGSYDTFYENADRVVRIAEELKTQSETLHQARSSPPMGPAFVADFPEVEAMTRVTFGDGTFRYEDRLYEEKQMFLADSTFFEVMGYPLLLGDAETALVNPYSVVLSESTARKYFDDANPLGETLIDENNEAFTVTGVVPDVPSNTHFRFEVLISMNTAFDEFGDDWWFWNAFYTYLLLREPDDLAPLQAKIPSFLTRYGIAAEQNPDGMGYATLPLVPLTDIHLTSDRTWEIQAGGNLTYLYIFSIVAVFILLIACINFMNLATARSAERAKEVGLRKVVGAHRLQVAGQFQSESLVMTMLAMSLALGLAWALMPVFNTLTGMAFTFGQLMSGSMAWLMLGLVLVVGLLAGSYPAWVLSRFEPSTVLKGTFRRSKQGTRLRQGLVVVQFAISIMLMVGTAVVMQQLDFLQSRNLGYTEDQIIVIDYGYDDKVGQQERALLDAMLAQQFITHAARSNSVPGDGTGNTFTRVQMGNGKERVASLNIIRTDLHFVDTYGLDVVAGRGISADFPNDTTQSVVLNEAAVRSLGWTIAEQAIGQHLTAWNETREIVGVVADYNYASLHGDIEPLILIPTDHGGTYFSLRLRSEDVQAAMASLEVQWAQLVPHRPFEAFFLDTFFNRQYQAEERFASLFRTFAGLAILIACLGLFGLAAFTAEQRTKEIGVRKVLGASVGQILGLLSKEFAVLVGIAFVVATPIVYYAMSEWLTTFAYRTTPDPLLFVGAGLLALIVAGLTISFQAAKAALRNPVDALRFE